MREHLGQARSLHYQLERQAWFLDAAEIYCTAVRALGEELAAPAVSSRGMQSLRRYLAGYADSESFTSLAGQTQELEEALAGIRYAVRINGARVTVSRYEGEPDYGAEVEETFARFKQGAAGSYLVKLPEHAGMDHVEARIAGLVAKLYPDVFAALDSYCTRHNGYLDPVIGRFDREVQFYLAYLELTGRCAAAGLPFCYPDVSARSKEIAAQDTFDIALANKLVAGGAASRRVRLLHVRVFLDKAEGLAEIASVPTVPVKQGGMHDARGAP